MKILLIEDDPDTAALWPTGCRTWPRRREGDDGRDGLFLAGEGRHDLLIVDRMLPGLNGLGLWSRRCAVPALTHRSCSSPPWTVDDRVEGLDAGGDAMWSSRSPSGSSWPASIAPAAAAPCYGRRAAEVAISSWMRHAVWSPRWPVSGAAAARVPVARIPDAPRRPCCHAHHATRTGLGLPLRAENQHCRYAHSRLRAKIGGAGEPELINTVAARGT